ncbi:MAG TPA: class III extradiol ring-cleavage dioxygenase [Candidatus Competibacter sp.]|nr:class III extradiol ring-cleavage dioxygenase [Candidatus Competibacter sp.]
MRFPSVFVSHGAPTLAVEDNPASRFLRAFGAELGRPRAILVVSAHWDTVVPTVSTAPRLETIHDFGGFDPALYAIRYEPPGAVETATRAQSLLQEAGFAVRADPVRGIDHGGWVPLSLMYPAADIPVLQLSVQSRLAAGHHFRLGQALRPLRDAGVLILASGSLTHNLREAFRAIPGAPTPTWVTEFGEWVARTLAEQRIDDVLDYERLGPHARQNHPTVEHFVPLLVALGAGTPDALPRRVHASTTLGVLAMDAYAFD